MSYLLLVWSAKFVELQLTFILDSADTDLHVALLKLCLFI